MTAAATDLASGSSRARRVLASLCIERLGGHFSALWPRDGASLGVYGHAREVLGIARRLNTPRHSRPAESTSPTVPSSKVKRSRYSPLTSTPMTSRSCSTKTILRLGIDRLQRLVLSCALPVRRQLVPPQDRSFCDEHKRAAWKRASDHGVGEIHRRGLPCGCGYCTSRISGASKLA